MNEPYATFTPLPGAKAAYRNVPPRVACGYSKYRNEKQEVASKIGAYKRFMREEKFLRIDWQEMRHLLDTPEIQLLLLDVRDEGAFRSSHIVGAQNYPARLLGRAIGNLATQIFEAAAADDAIICLYDDDDLAVKSAANVFFERGVDRVYVLTSGLSLFSQMCPELVEHGASRPGYSAAMIRAHTDRLLADLEARPGSPSMLKPWGGRELAPRSRRPVSPTLTRGAPRASWRPPTVPHGAHARFEEDAPAAVPPGSSAAQALAIRRGMRPAIGDGVWRPTRTRPNFT